MGLTPEQKRAIKKAQLDGGKIVLKHDVCAFLVGTIANDLGLQEHFPEIAQSLPQFFSSEGLDASLPCPSCFPLLERLFSLDPDAERYFCCLAALHRHRLKYRSILTTQPVPTLEQVGPRGLLQYGSMSPGTLANLLLWRKWFSDLDNRASQRTGYLFEQIATHVLGGAACHARSSPVKTGGDGAGRQVDCLCESRAYECKIRVTEAASGQGRWKKQLSFPQDCRQSGYEPVLLVLDGTASKKLEELRGKFEAAEGKCYVGAAAWQHLADEASPTMRVFLQKYVQEPLEALAKEATGTLPDLLLQQTADSVTLTIAGEPVTIPRSPTQAEAIDEGLPEDVDEETVGP